jgi:hypothetical protein
MAAVKEGDGTLLDNMLVFAHSDVSFAKNHDVSGVPVMLAGRAGGRIKPGLHVNGGGELVTRVGLTVQQAMGLQVGSWGHDGMQTTRSIPDILV